MTNPMSDPAQAEAQAAFDSAATQLHPPDAPVDPWPAPPAPLL
jgi:hypothetical protein